jgi:uncharacterized membrane protein
MEMKQDLYFIDENRKRRHKVKVEKWEMFVLCIFIYENR